MDAGFQVTIAILPAYFTQNFSHRPEIASFLTALMKPLTRGGELAVFTAVLPCRPDPTGAVTQMDGWMDG